MLWLAPAGSSISPPAQEVCKIFGTGTLGWYFELPKAQGKGPAVPGFPMSVVENGASDVLKQIVAGLGGLCM
jgi:hypothetical protein